MASLEITFQDHNPVFSPEIPDSPKNFDKSKITWEKNKHGLYQAYYPDDDIWIKVPSVSSILDLIPDPDWEKFKEEVGEEKANKLMKIGMDRGTAMHLFIENFINKFSETKDPGGALQYSLQVTVPDLIKEDIPPDMIEMGRNMFYNFYHSHHSSRYKDLYGTEISIFSPVWFFRGKADVFYNEQGIGRTVTDFKGTSKAIERGSVKLIKYLKQLGAYAIAVEDTVKYVHNKDVSINRSSILAVHTKSNMIQDILLENDQLNIEKEAFKTLCKEWHIINGQGFLF